VLPLRHAHAPRAQTAAQCSSLSEDLCTPECRFICNALDCNGVRTALQVVAHEDKRSAQAEALYERSQEQSAVGGEGDKPAVHSLTSALSITPQDIKLLVARAACYRCVGVDVVLTDIV
jgi:hypothetical protein